jgi:hypothetical protein
MCTKARASGWSFRLVKEGEISSLSLFITLTYNTDHVPVTKRGFMSLDRDTFIENPNYEKQLKRWEQGKRKKKPKEEIFKSSHLTLFFKSLRKAGHKNVRYYAVGEYGGITWRPHYHIILFNTDIQAVLDHWKLGEVHFGTVSEASIGYTLKYISKTKKVPQHQNDDRVPEYSRMSKGIGANYLTDKMKEWHKKNLDERLYVPLEDGKKAPMPRYYKDRIYNKQERGHLKGVMEKLAYQKEMEERLLLGENYETIIADRVKNNKLKQSKNENNGKSI